MADNVDITPGTGATVAADDVAGVLYQRVKLAQGADGSATDVSSAAPLQVTLANGTVPSHAVTNAGTFAVQAVCTNAGTFATQSVCTNAGTFAVQVDGSALTALALIDDTIFADDAAFTLTSSKVSMAGAIHDAALSGLAAAEGDAVPLRVDGFGALWVSVYSTVLPTGASTAANQTTIIGHLDGVEGLLGTIDADTSALAGCVGGTEVQVDIVGALPAGTNAIGKLAANSGVDIGDVDCTSLTGSTIAHDAADSGNPHKIGAKATAALSGATMVSAGDRTDLFAGIDGVQITRPHCNLEDITTGQAAITDGSSTSVISAQGAGVKTYITSVIIANTSATAVTVDLRDGTAGSVKATLPVPANTSGVVCNLPVPLPFSANTAVAADPSAAASTITVTLIGFKSKV